MPSDRERNDFINFIIDATQEVELAESFLEIETAEDVHKFFQKEGYKDIPLNDCEDILTAAKSMRGRGVNSAGEPVDSSRASKGY